MAITWRISACDSVVIAVDATIATGGMSGLIHSGGNLRVQLGLLTAAVEKDTVNCNRSKYK